MSPRILLLGLTATLLLSGCGGEEPAPGPEQPAPLIDPALLTDPAPDPLPDRSPDRLTAEAQLQAAMQAYEAEDYLTAVSGLEAVLVATPGNLSAQLALAWSLLHAGKQAKATRDAGADALLARARERFEALDPALFGKNGWKVAFGRGHVLYLQGDAAAARPLLEAVVAVEGNMECLLLLSRVCFALEDPEAAKTHARRALDTAVRARQFWEAFKAKAPADEEVWGKHLTSAIERADEARELIERCD